MSKLLCKVLKFGEMPKFPPPSLIISCCQLQLEWTELGWWLASTFSQLCILKRHCFCKLSQNRMLSRRKNKAFYNCCMNSKFWVFGSAVFRFSQQQVLSSTASSSLWLRQCHNTMSGNSSLSNIQTLISSLTLRLHYCKIQWRLLIATHRGSHSLGNSPKLRL